MGSLVKKMAQYGKELEISGINDIVEVRRYMSHIFLRNMSQQVFAVSGSILTVTALSDNTVFRWVVGIVLTSGIAIYLVMPDVRIGTKRSSRDTGAI